MFNRSRRLIYHFKRRRSRLGCNILFVCYQTAEIIMRAVICCVLVLCFCQFAGGQDGFRLAPGERIVAIDGVPINPGPEPIWIPPSPYTPLPDDPRRKPKPYYPMPGPYIPRPMPPRPMPPLRISPEKSQVIDLWVRPGVNNYSLQYRNGTWSLVR